MKLSEKKRLQIVTAAESLFASQGVEATSMDQVSSLAEVSKRTVYNHFATKGELFQAVLEAMFAKVDQGKQFQFTSDCSIESQLMEIAAQEVELLTSPAFLKIAKVAFMQMLQDANLANSLNGQSVGCLRFFEQFLSDAVKAEVLNVDDVSLAAKQFVYQLKSLLFYPLLYGISSKDELNVDYLVLETVKLFLARYQK
ncbi:TetR/AcrR family transcriptional regulator [Pseudoalteromonas xiamenensis]